MEVSLLSGPASFETAEEAMSVAQHEQYMRNWRPYSASVADRIPFLADPRTSPSRQRLSDVLRDFGQRSKTTINGFRCEDDE